VYQSRGEAAPTQIALAFGVCELLNSAFAAVSMEQMGSYPVRRHDSVTLAMGGGSRLRGWISGTTRRHFVFRLLRLPLLAAVLFFPLLSSPAEERPDLCELPIEVLMQMEFIPAASRETSVQSDGATSAFQTLLVPGTQIRSLVLPDGWGLCLPCFWVVVFDGSEYEVMVTDGSRHVSEHMAK